MANVFIQLSIAAIVQSSPNGESANLRSVRSAFVCFFCRWTFRWAFCCVTCLQFAVKACMDVWQKPWQGACRCSCTPVISGCFYSALRCEKGKQQTQDVNIIHQSERWTRNSKLQKMSFSMCELAKDCCCVYAYLHWQLRAKHISARLLSNLTWQRLWMTPTLLTRALCWSLGSQET